MQLSRPHEDAPFESETPLVNWFNAERRGRMILTPNLELSWCNLAARKLIGNRQRLALRGGCLRPSSLRDQQRFEAFVRDAGDRLSVLCLSDENGENHLLTTAIRLPGTTLVGLTAFRVWQDFDALWADLHEAFGLTRSEQEICRLLGSGLTADAIADKMRTSIKTVRTHIRHVYSKLGVCSREELFHKLMPYIIVE
jgi:DNA-binding CsgD family transcriptional regulator